jgi:hypothetical protein
VRGPVECLALARLIAVRSIGVADVGVIFEPPQLK